MNVKTSFAHEPSRRPFSDLSADGPASLVVALVALPLCLGIALASGAPPLAGLLTGIIGGMVVAWLSGSALAVSGPAAGLTVIVLGGIDALGYRGFLLATVLAGLIQVGFGLARLGIFGLYFPSSVIRGMLSAIGIILLLKQIPHAVGYDGDYEGDMSFVQADGRNTLTEIPYALGHFHWGAVLVAAVSLGILLWAARSPRMTKIRLLPPPLLAVGAGTLLNVLLVAVAPSLAVHDELLVQIPQLSLDALTFPDLSMWADAEVYRTAATIAIIASIETLLCLEAVDKLDPFRRVSPPNRELIAQGVGNVVAGAVGGIPMTAVVVRGSANVSAGGRTPTSSFLHGTWLLLALLLIPGVLNAIPLAALAAVLLDVGYKLAPVRLFRQMAKEGGDQMLPFAATLLGILFTDLLVGVSIGLVVGIFFILRANLATPYFLHRREEHETSRRVEVRLELSENVSFLNKAAVRQALDDLPEGTFVEIDGSSSRYIDHDVVETIHEFAESTAPGREIEVVLSHIPERGALGAH